MKTVNLELKNVYVEFWNQDTVQVLQDFWDRNDFHHFSDLAFIQIKLILIILVPSF